MKKPLRLMTVIPFLPVLLLPAALLAHDTWLVPSAFRPQPGTSVALRLATSEAFPTSDVAASPDRIARFTLGSAADKRNVMGYTVQGNFLVATVEPSATAGHVVAVVETKPRAFVLEPKIFNEYLRHEELKQTIAARAAAGKADSPGRERYRKITKAVLCVGDVKDSAYAQPEGLWVEIVPEQSPCSLKTGDALTVRVLFEGKPLAGAHVAAGYEGVTGHYYPIWLPTDAQGRTRVKLDRPGVWFVRTLHMVPTVNDAEADWQSAFSTLTFEVTGPKPSADEVAIRKLLADQAVAWNHGDIDGFMAGYWQSEELTFSGSNGVTRGWRGLLERYRRSYPDRAAMGHLRFFNLEITLLGPEGALILGNWQLDREKDTPGGVFSLVAQKIAVGNKKEWRIIHDHTSSVVEQQ